MLAPPEKADTQAGRVPEQSPEEGEGGWPSQGASGRIPGQKDSEQGWPRRLWGGWASREQGKEVFQTLFSFVKWG